MDNNLNKSTTEDHPSELERITFSENSTSFLRHAPNERATFFVKIDCDENDDILPLTFEWKRDDVPIHSSDRFRITQTSNAVQLAVEHVQSEDAGHYTLYAKTKRGQLIKKDVELCVEERSVGEDPPVFLRRLSELSVKVGTRSRLLVEIRSSTDVKVTWYRNDRRICDDNRIKQINEGSFYCVEIAPVVLDDGGRWMVMAENLGGRNSCICSLNILVPKAYKPPEFIEELKAVLTEQGTVSLECKVIGVPTPVLRWFKDSREIKAGDVFALTANADDPTSLGTYTCEAVNCMGKSYSSSKVHVTGRGSREGSMKPADSVQNNQLPPIFTNELKGAKVRIGDIIILGCQVVVPPWPKTISWYNKAGRVETSERYKLIEDGLGIYMIEVKPSESCDEGEWKCVVTSAEGAVGISSCLVDMEIPRNYRRPKFLESLRAILTEEGLVSFECKVVGFPTPILKWFKDGQELKPGDVYQLTGTNSLGTYCCVAKNCMGENKSVAVLTVEDIQNQLNDEERMLLSKQNQPPKFVVGLKSQDAKINEEFRFSVTVDASPEPLLSWYRDELPIESNDRYNHYTENGKNNLDIRCVEFVDQAEWKCVAVNEFGTSVTSCFLRLQIPRHYKKPRFLECLRAVLTEEGAVNLECKVIGVPQPVLKWYKDGVELKPGDIHRIISGEDGTCCLGTYTCEARNCMGIVASSASLLGFDDAAKNAEHVKEQEKLELQRNFSLSTIHEERTSQLYETPGDITIDEKGDVSFSFDGKEVSVSLYETPDLTEEEALKIVEMYADQISEHITEHNIVELPPLRFIKETSQSGNLLMEAVVIDISPEYFSHEEDLRTEAGMDDISICEMTIHGMSAQEDFQFDKETENFAKRSFENMEIDLELSAAIRRRKKSRGTEIEEYFSLSNSKADDDTSELQTFASAQMASSIMDDPGALSLEPIAPKRKKSRTTNGESDSPSKTPEVDIHMQDISGEAGDGFQYFRSAEQITDDTIIQNNMGLLVPLAMDLNVIEKHLKVVEDEVVAQSGMMMSPASADQSIQIISNVLIPLQQIQGKLRVYSGEIPVEILFEALSENVKELQQNLHVIEKCVEMDEAGVTLVQRTSVCLIDSVGEKLLQALSEVDTISNTFERESLKKEINSITEDMRQGILATQTTIKSQTQLQLESAEYITETVTKLQNQSEDAAASFDNVTSGKFPNEAQSLKTFCQAVLRVQSALDEIQPDDKAGKIMERIIGPIENIQQELNKITTKSNANADKETLEQKIDFALIDIVTPPMFELRKEVELLQTEIEMEKVYEIVEAMLPPLQEIQNGLAQLGQDVQRGQIGHDDDFPSDSPDVQKLLKSVAQALLYFENNIDELSTISILSGDLHKGLCDLKSDLSRLVGIIIDNPLTKYQISLLENIKPPLDEVNYCLRQIEAKSVSGSFGDLIEPLQSLHDKAKLGEDILLLAGHTYSDLDITVLSQIRKIVKDIESEIEQHDYRLLQEEIAMEGDVTLHSSHEAEMLHDADKVIGNAIVSIEQLQSCIGAIQEQAVFSDVQSYHGKSMQEVFVQSLKNIHECVAEIKEIYTFETVDELINSGGIDALQHIARPLQTFVENFKLITEVKLIEGTDSMTTQENLSALKALAEPALQLEACIAEVESAEHVTHTLLKPLRDFKTQLSQIVHQIIEPLDEHSTMDDISMIRTASQIDDVSESLKADEPAVDPLLGSLQRCLTNTLRYCIELDVASLNSASLQELRTVAGKLHDFQQSIANVPKESIKAALSKTSDRSEATLLEELRYSVKNIQSIIDKVSQSQSISESDIKSQLEELRQCMQCLHTDIFENVESMSARTESTHCERIVQDINELVAIVNETNALDTLQSLRSENNFAAQELVQPLLELQNAILQVDYQTHISQTENLSSFEHLSELETIAKPLLSLKNAIVNIQQQVPMEALENHPSIKIIKDKSQAIYELLKYVEHLNCNVLEGVADISTQDDISALKTYAESAYDSKSLKIAVAEQVDLVQEQSVKISLEDGLKQITECLQSSASSIEYIEEALIEMKHSIEALQTELITSSVSESQLLATSNIPKALFKLKECLVHTYESHEDNSFEDIERIFEDILQSVPSLEVLLNQQMSERVLNEMSKFVESSNQLPELQPLAPSIRDLRTVILKLIENEEIELVKSNEVILDLKKRLTNTAELVKEVTKGVPRELVEPLKRLNSKIIAALDFFDSVDDPLRLIEVIQEIDAIADPLNTLQSTSLSISEPWKLNSNVVEILRPVVEAREFLSMLHQQLLTDAGALAEFLSSAGSNIELLKCKLDELDNEILNRRIDSFTHHDIVKIDEISKVLEQLKLECDMATTTSGSETSFQDIMRKLDDMDTEVFQTLTEPKVISETNADIFADISEDAKTFESLKKNANESVSGAVSESTTASIAASILAKVSAISRAIDDLDRTSVQKVSCEILDTLKKNVSEVNAILDENVTLEEMNDSLFLPIFKLLDLVAFSANIPTIEDTIFDVLLRSNEVAIEILNNCEGLRRMVAQDLLQNSQDEIKSFLQSPNNVLPNELKASMEGLSEILATLVASNEPIIMKSSQNFQQFQTCTIALRDSLEAIEKDCFESILVTADTIVKFIESPDDQEINLIESMQQIDFLRLQLQKFNKKLHNELSSKKALKAKESKEEQSGEIVTDCLTIRETTDFSSDLNTQKKLDILANTIGSFVLLKNSLQVSKESELDATLQHLQIEGNKNSEESKEPIRKAFTLLRECILNSSADNKFELDFELNQSANQLLPVYGNIQTELANSLQLRSFDHINSYIEQANEQPTKVALTNLNKFCQSFINTENVLIETNSKLIVELQTALMAAYVAFHDQSCETSVPHVIDGIAKIKDCILEFHALNENANRSVDVFEVAQKMHSLAWAVLRLSEARTDVHEIQTQPEALVEAEEAVKLSEKEAAEVEAIETKPFEIDTQTTGSQRDQTEVKESEVMETDESSAIDFKEPQIAAITTPASKLVKVQDTEIEATTEQDMEVQEGKPSVEGFKATERETDTIKISDTQRMEIEEVKENKAMETEKAEQVKGSSEKVATEVIPIETKPFEVDIQTTKTQVVETEQVQESKAMETESALVEIQEVKSMKMEPTEEQDINILEIKPGLKASEYGTESIKESDTQYTEIDEIQPTELKKDEETKDTEIKEVETSVTKLADIEKHKLSEQLSANMQVENETQIEIEGETKEEDDPLLSIKTTESEEAVAKPITTSQPAVIEEVKTSEAKTVEVQEFAISETQSAAVAELETIEFKTLEAIESQPIEIEEIKPKEPRKAKLAQLAESTEIEEEEFSKSMIGKVEHVETSKAQVAEVEEFKPEETQVAESEVQETKIKPLEPKTEEIAEKKMSETPIVGEEEVQEVAAESLVIQLAGVKNIESQIADIQEIKSSGLKAEIDEVKLSEIDTSESQDIKTPETQLSAVKKEAVHETKLTEIKVPEKLDVDVEASKSIEAQADEQEAVARPGTLIASIEDVKPADLPEAQKCEIEEVKPSPLEKHEIQETNVPETVVAEVDVKRLETCITGMEETTKDEMVEAFKASETQHVSAFDIEAVKPQEPKVLKIESTDAVESQVADIQQAKSSKESFEIELSEQNSPAIKEIIPSVSKASEIESLKDAELKAEQADRKEDLEEVIQLQQEDLETQTVEEIKPSETKVFEQQDVITPEVQMGEIHELINSKGKNVENAAKNLAKIEEDKQVVSKTVEEYQIKSLASEGQEQDQQVPATLVSEEKMVADTEPQVAAIEEVIFVDASDSKIGEDANLSAQKSIEVLEKPADSEVFTIEKSKSLDTTSDEVAEIIESKTCLEVQKVQVQLKSTETSSLTVEDVKTTETQVAEIEESKPSESWKISQPKSLEAQEVAKEEVKSAESSSLNVQDVKTSEAQVAEVEESKSSQSRKLSQSKSLEAQQVKEEEVKSTESSSLIVQEVKSPEAQVAEVEESKPSKSRKLSKPKSFEAKEVKEEVAKSAESSSLNVQDDKPAEAQVAEDDESKPLKSRKLSKPKSLEDQEVKEEEVKSAESSSINVEDIKTEAQVAKVEESKLSSSRKLLKPKSLDAKEVEEVEVKSDESSSLSVQDVKTPGAQVAEVDESKPLKSKNLSQSKALEAQDAKEEEVKSAESSSINVQDIKTPEAQIAEVEESKPSKLRKLSKPKSLDVKEVEEVEVKSDESSSLNVQDVKTPEAQVAEVEESKPLKSRKLSQPKALEAQEVKEEEVKSAESSSINVQDIKTEAQAADVEKSKPSKSRKLSKPKSLDTKEIEEVKVKSDESSSLNVQDVKTPEAQVAEVNESKPLKSRKLSQSKALEAQDVKEEEVKSAESSSINVQDIKTPEAQIAEVDESNPSKSRKLSKPKSLDAKEVEEVEVKSDESSSLNVQDVKTPEAQVAEVVDSKPLKSRKLSQPKALEVQEVKKEEVKFAESSSIYVQDIKTEAQAAEVEESKPLESRKLSQPKPLEAQEVKEEEVKSAESSSLNVQDIKTPEAQVAEVEESKPSKSRPKSLDAKVVEEVEGKSDELSSLNVQDVKTPKAQVAEVEESKPLKSRKLSKPKSFETLDVKEAEVKEENAKSAESSSLNVQDVKTPEAQVAVVEESKPSKSIKLPKPKSLEAQEVKEEEFKFAESSSVNVQDIKTPEAQIAEVEESKLSKSRKLSKPKSLDAKEVEQVEVKSAETSSINVQDVKTPEAQVAEVEETKPSISKKLSKPKSLESQEVKEEEVKSAESSSINVKDIKTEAQAAEVEESKPLKSRKLSKPKSIDAKEVEVKSDESSSLNVQDVKTPEAQVAEVEESKPLKSRKLSKPKSLEAQEVKEEEVKSAESSSINVQDIKTSEAQIVEVEESKPSKSRKLSKPKSLEAQEVKEEEVKSAESSSINVQDIKTPEAQVAEVEESKPLKSTKHSQPKALEAQEVKEREIKSAESSLINVQEVKTPEAQVAEVEESKPLKSRKLSTTKSLESHEVKEEEVKIAESSSLSVQEVKTPEAEVEESKPSKSRKLSNKSLESQKVKEKDVKSPESSSLSAQEVKTPEAEVAVKESKPSKSRNLSKPKSLDAKEVEEVEVKSDESSSLNVQDVKTPEAQVAEVDESKPLESRKLSKPKSFETQEVNEAEVKSAESSSLSVEEVKSPQAQVAEVEKSKPTKSRKEVKAAESSSLSVEEVKIPESEVSEVDESKPSKSRKLSKPKSPEAKDVKEEDVKSAESSSLNVQNAKTEKAKIAEVEESKPTKSSKLSKPKSIEAQEVKEENVKSSESSSLNVHAVKTPEAQVAEVEESEPLKSRKLSKHGSLEAQEFKEFKEESKPLEPKSLAAEDTEVKENKSVESISAKDEKSSEAQVEKSNSSKSELPKTKVEEPKLVESTPEEIVDNIEQHKSTGSYMEVKLSHVTPSESGALNVEDIKSPETMYLKLTNLLQFPRKRRGQQNLNHAKMRRLKLKRSSLWNPFHSTFKELNL